MSQRAFTLIEITTALVIIALLISGIIAGRSLILSARYHATLSEVQNYERALTQFQERFKYLPGDFPTATTYWSSTTGNGDGNWLVEETNESLRAWQHLALAGIVSKPFNGILTVATASPNVNVPLAQFGDGRGIYHLRAYTDTGIYAHTGNAIEIVRVANDGTAHNGILSAKDAYALDSKIDDGIADQGYIYASLGDDFLTSACVSDVPSATTASYQLTDITQSCRLHFWFDRRLNEND